MKKVISSQPRTTDAQWRIFSLKPQTFGLGQTNRADKFWGFRLNYQHPFWYCESLVHVFHYSTIVSTKTKPLYPHPKYLFGIGIWIWIWTAKNQGLSLRVSVVRVLSLQSYGKKSHSSQAQGIRFKTSWNHFWIRILIHKNIFSFYSSYEKEKS